MSSFDSIKITEKMRVTTVGRCGRTMVTCGHCVGRSARALMPACVWLLT